MNNDQASTVLPETRSTRRPASNSTFLLQAVAALKLLEALVLCATGVAALELLRPDITQGVENWLSLLPLSSEQRIAQHLLNSLTGLGPHRIKALGGVVFAYAALFVVEGVGLLRKKRWAEWVTVLTTALLVPFELWELSERATLAKAGALAINLLVLWYLVHRIRASSSAHNIK
jgi:uncharacterized membrane protein (DUF2068 family)